MSSLLVYFLHFTSSLFINKKLRLYLCISARPWRGNKNQQNYLLIYGKEKSGLNEKSIRICMWERGQINQVWPRKSVDVVARRLESEGARPHHVHDEWGSGHCDKINTLVKISISEPVFHSAGHWYQHANPGALSVIESLCYNVGLGAPSTDIPSFQHIVSSGSGRWEMGRVPVILFVYFCTNIFWYKSIMLDLVNFRIID